MSNVLGFVLQRLLQASVVMVVVAFVSFLLFQYVGDPVVFLLGQDATPEQIQSLRADLGLDQPFFVQFWHFLINAMQGEFGLSLRQGAKVSRLIAERFPATFELALVAAGLALLLGACNLVHSDHPLFFAEADAPRLREGVWVLETGDDACRHHSLYRCRIDLIGCCNPTCKFHVN